MNRREFGIAAIGATAAALIAPVARAGELRAITDCIVIDYEKPKQRFVLLDEPDEKGHKFVFEDADQRMSYRHIEFLRNDGLVMGESWQLSRWSRNYDSFKNEFLSTLKPSGAKSFTYDEFLKYAQEVREYFDGRMVPSEELGIGSDGERFN
jgi:hypothetical protein